MGAGLAAKVADAAQNGSATAALRLTPAVVPKIQARKPTGRVPYPIVLVEGEDSSGKSYQAALLTASDKVGESFWFDVDDQGTADEYGAIPGVRYQVIETDGTFVGFLGQFRAVKARAREVADAGERPVVSIVDSTSVLWDGIKSWATEKAAGSDANRRKLAADPSAEVRVSQNLWNDAGSRWRRFMTEVLTFPGIVILTARGREVAEVRNGVPVEGSKVWKVEGQKDLAYQPTAIIRTTREHGAKLVGCKSLRCGLIPGKDKPLPFASDWTLEGFIFGELGFDPRTATVRRSPDMDHAAEEPRPVPAPDPAVPHQFGYTEAGDNDRCALPGCGRLLDENPHPEATARETTTTGGNES